MFIEKLEKLILLLDFPDYYLRKKKHSATIRHLHSTYITSKERLLCSMFRVFHRVRFQGLICKISKVLSGKNCKLLTSNLSGRTFADIPY